MNPLDCFSTDYFAARTRFREVCQSRGATLSRYPIGTEGHTIDLARFGSTNVDTLLILSSGLHGVEGFFGSAVQLAWLQKGLAQLPSSVGALLIHGLNPIGFDQCRRFNEENIDLNRNFLEPEQFARLHEESKTSLYAKLDPYLNPPSAPGAIDGFPCMAVWLLMRYGREKLRASLPVGQYAFPKGLFYGGQGAAETTRIVMNSCAEWIGSAKQIMHLDWHTGLGDFATYKLLFTQPAEDLRAKQLREIFGDTIETPDGPTSYRSRGDMGEWLMKRFPDRDYLFLCAEFGTYSNTYTLKKLRQENRARHYSSPEAPIRERARQELLEAFVPASAKWRESVIRQSLEIVHAWHNKRA